MTKGIDRVITLADRVISEFNNFDWCLHANKFEQKKPNYGYVGWLYCTVASHKILVNLYVIEFRGLNRGETFIADLDNALKKHSNEDQIVHSIQSFMKKIVTF